MNIKNRNHILNLEKYFINELVKTNIKFNINGSPRIPGIISITFDHIDGQSLLMQLDMKGISISYGSACASGSSKASLALLEIGMSEEKAKKTVRISIGKFISKDDINVLVKAINGIINNG